MIPSNLKVGDIFEDGGYRYKVKAVTEQGYLSSRTNEEPIKEEVKEEIPEDDPTPISKTAINRMSNKELSTLCEKYELPIATGAVMKKALIEKLGL